MSAATAPARCQLSTAATILAKARAAAHDGDAAAALLVDTLRLTHADEASEAAWLQDVCSKLAADPSFDLACRRPAMFWRVLVAELQDAYRQERKRHPQPFRIAQALCHGPRWLADAAQLATRDAHRMRRPGGCRLRAQPVGDDRVVAELIPAKPSPGQPPGEVLRLTWSSTAHRIAQSCPGRWAVVDVTAEPT